MSIASALNSPVAHFAAHAFTAAQAIPSMHSNETFDPVTRVIDFSVKVAGRDVPCRVTADWLTDAYGAGVVDEGLQHAFAKRRAVIEATALRSWLASRGVEPVWLKREHVWRQSAGADGQARVLEKHTA